MAVEFELLRFEAAPAGAAVAVVELEGRFTGLAPARVRLLAEHDGRRVESPALAVTDGEDTWSASFAVELAALDAGAELSLVPGRGPLIALPAPELAGGAGDDRFVRLARQANELRHRLTEAVEASAARERVGAELAADRDRLRGELDDVLRRAEAAEATARSARDQRDSATAAADEARDELREARTALREAEARATEAERDRAALRARAEAAERSAAEAREGAAAAEGRAREAEERTVALEDEIRTLRRDLRDTRARVEALLREQRHHGGERRGHEVPEAAGNGHDADTVVVDAGPDGAADAEADDAAEAADAAPTTPVDPGDDPAEQPAPARTVTRRTRVVRIVDDPALGADEILEPAAVGARFIEPAETPSRLLTPARIVVGIVVLLLAAALVVILLGGGFV